MKLCTVIQLADETTGDPTKARKLLEQLQIPVIEGFFDRDRFNSAMAVPLTERRKPLEWNLSPTHGLGAIKACIDEPKEKLSLVAHYMRKEQAIEIAGPTGAVRYLRLYYTNKTTHDNTTATFTLKNFLNDGYTSHYAFCALGIPAMWVYSNAELQKRWQQLRKRWGSPTKEAAPSITIPMYAWPVPRSSEGILKLRLSLDDKQHLVSRKALGI